MIDERLAQEFERVAATQSVDVRAALDAAHARAPRARRRRRILVAAAAMAAVATVGAAGLAVATQLVRSDGVDPSKQATSLLRTSETLSAYPAAQVVGTLEREGDCLTVGGRGALFPPGTRLKDDVVTLPRGATTRLGAEADWSGGYFKVASVKEMAGSEETYQAVLRCAENAGAEEVALVTP